MVKQQACPDDADLKRLASGELVAEAIDTLARHLEVCAACLEKVRTMAPTDTLVNSLPLARNKSAALQDTGEVSGLIGKLKSMAAPSPADTINFGCGCGKKLKVKAELAGKKVKCPGCGKVLSVPAMPEAAPAVSTEDRTVPPDEKLSLSRSESAAVSNDQTESHKKSDENDEAWDFLAPAQSADEIGRLGGYRILEVLGRGGMGVVFRAEDPNLKRIVALKAMLPSLAASPSAKKRFLREAQTAASIKHDHIVTIHQVGEDRGAPFLAMEFLHGEPLDVRLKREGKLSIPEVLRIGRETAEGLAAAHDRGLIHRDIKPGNVWLETKEEGRRIKDEKIRAASLYRVKILDFGLARSTDDQTGLTQSGAIIGTPAYMAPEQGNGGTVDQRCDLFSLGCMLYALTTGKLPFSGKDTLSILMAIATKDPKPPIEWNPAIPREFSDLILKLLAKDANDRPSDAHEVAESLSVLADTFSAASTTTDLLAIRERPLADSAGVRAWSKQGTGSPSQSPGRRRTFLLLGVLGLLALVALGIVFFLPAGNGTIRVEINDPDIEVAVGAKGVTIKGTEKQGDIVVAAGEHSLKVKRDNLEFETEKIVLKKGETVTVKVEWLKDGKLQVMQEGKAIGERITQSQTGRWALEFDGKSYVDLPTLERNDAGPFTLEAWVAVARIGEAGLIVRVVGTAQIQISSDRDHLRGAEDFVKNYVTLTSDRGAAVPGRWTHVALVASDNKLALYLDGRLTRRIDRGTEVAPGGIGAPSRIGEEARAFFEGKLREIRVSKAARYDKDFAPAHRFEPDADTLALYHFDEGRGDVLKDSSGNGHHGKIVGAKWVRADGSPITPPSTSSPPPGVALEFDGRTTHVNVPTLNLNASGPMTVEARVRFSKSTGGNDTIASGYSPMTAILLCRMNGINPVFLARKDLESKFVGLDGNLENDVWVHVAGVWDRKVARLFVDGKPQPNVIEKQLTLAMTASQGQHLILGADRVTPLQPLGGFFHGQMADVRISKVARYDKEFVPPLRFEKDTNTIALYKFDEGQGDKLNDSSGNGHHGKIVGAKWVKVDGAPIVNPPANNLALRFDGQQRVDIPDLKLPTDSPYTMEGYFHPDADKVGGVDNYAMGVPSQSHLSYTKNGDWRWAAPKSGDTKAGIPGISARPRPHHIACVYDGKQRRVFVDGQQVGKTTTAVEVAANRTFVLGGSYFGTIDEVRVSKVARYNANFTPAGRFEPDADTLALYHCDEGQGDKLVDSSGNGRHGTIVGAKWVKADGAAAVNPPAPNLALRFDGGQRVDIASLKLPTDGPYTMEGYFFADDDKVGGPASCVMGIHNQSHLGYSKGGQWRWQATKSGNPKLQIQGLSVKPGRQHIACVYDGKLRRVYLDGQLSGRPASPGETSANKPFELGASFFGTIDEVRVSKVARYTADFTPSARFEPDADTLALYHCDEGQGDKLVDSSGNGHHGTIVGAKWVKVGAPIAAAELVFDTRGRVEVPSLLHDKKEPWTIEVVFTSQDSRGIDHFAGFEKGLRLRSLSRERIQSRFGAEPHSTLHSLPMDRFISGRQEAALVYTGNEILGFQNGKYLGRIDAKDYDPAEVKGPFMIAQDFGGRMYQVRVSKSARYANDYAPGQAFVADKDTLALYSFDEGEGDVIKDHSRNGHDGKIVGAKWVKAGETKIAPVPTVTHADRLAFLEWFAQEKAINKSVRIEQDGTVFPLKGKTPAGPFLIRGVNLRHSKEGLALADEDMARIASISEIQELNLSHRTISEAGMAHLARLTELRKLYLGDSTIPIESATVVRGLPKLESLHFPKATDTWIEALAGMPSLRFVQFYRQPVSDSALARFKDFPGLAAVQFKECKVSEARLLQLKEVKSLRLLILEKKGGSGNDADAYKRLAQELPECEIRDSRGKNATIYNKGKADGLKLEPDEPNEEGPVYLDELTEKSFFALGGEFYKSGTDPFAKNWRNNFTMTGDPPVHALMIHPVPKREGHVTYDLGGKYATFQTTARCRNGRVAPLYVEIFGDGRLLAKSENLAKATDAGVELKVDVRGVKEMKIVIDAEEKTTYSHVLLLEPRITLTAKSDASSQALPANLGDWLASPGYEWSAPENLGPGVNSLSSDASCLSRRPKTFGVSGAGALGFDLAIARFGARDERVDQGARDGGDFVHGAMEGRFVGRGRLVEARQFPHELQRRRLDFLIGRGRSEIKQHLDIAAHGAPHAMITSCDSNGLS